MTGSSVFFRAPARADLVLFVYGLTRPDFALFALDHVSVGSSLLLRGIGSTRVGAIGLWHGSIGLVIADLGSFSLWIVAVLESIFLPGISASNLWPIAVGLLFAFTRFLQLRQCDFHEKLRLTREYLTHLWHVQNRLLSIGAGSYSTWSAIFITHVCVHWFVFASLWFGTTWFFLFDAGSFALRLGPIVEVVRVSRLPIIRLWPCQA